MEVDDTISYHDVVTAEKASLQKGMNYCVGNNYAAFMIPMMNAGKGNMMTAMHTTPPSSGPIMDFRKEHAIETYRSLITIALAGLKTLMLINGGAVVALLAYLGQSPLGPTLAPRVLWSLGAFVVGVVSCVGAFFGSYQTQFALYNEAVSPATKAAGSHMRWQRITLAFVLLSCVAFAIGAFLTAWLLSHKA